MIFSDYFPEFTPSCKYTMMMNWFSEMVGHCKRYLPSQIPDPPQTGFEPAQNLSSDFFERSCAVVITTASLRQAIPWSILYYSTILYYSSFFHKKVVPQIIPQYICLMFYFKRKLGIPVYVGGDSLYYGCFRFPTVRKFLKTSNNKQILSDTLEEFVEIVLKNNEFEFHYQTFKQKPGTAMRMNFAPP